MKKFVISSEALRPALKRLSQAVSTSTVLPVLKNIYFKVAKDEVEMITTDTELTISYKCPADTEGEPFDLLIPFDFLNKIVALIKSAPITVQHPSARKAWILGTNDKYELSGLDDLALFPKHPSIPKKNSLGLTKGFVGLLSHAMHTAAKGELKFPALLNACLDIEPSGVTLVSTDTQVLYRYKLPINLCGGPDQLLLTPKIATALEGLEEIDLLWHDSQLAFRSRNVTIWATRNEGKFPNYKAIVPNHLPNLELNRAVFIDALNKACLSSSVIKSTTIHLKNSPGTVHFEIDDPDYNRKIQVDFAGSYSGEADSIVIDAKKMLTMMKQVDVESIRLHIAHPTKAVLVSSEEDESYLGLIMPLKINN